eukprot:scaffold298033_cov18-Tisochrysis_lutea.AAC.1
MNRCTLQHKKGQNKRSFVKEGACAFITAEPEGHNKSRLFAKEGVCVFSTAGHMHGSPGKATQGTGWLSICFHTRNAVTEPRHIGCLSTHVTAFDWVAMQRWRAHMSAFTCASVCFCWYPHEKGPETAANDSPSQHCKFQVASSP